MLRLILKNAKFSQNPRFLSISSTLLNRVTIIGSAGGIGQALAMLMKADDLVSALVLMDIKNTAGIAADISHIDTNSEVVNYTGAENMEKSLECSNLVVVAGGITLTEKMKYSDLFEANKELIYHVSSLKAKICPEAFMAIITNPINSLVPLAAETLKQSNAYDPKKLFGITKLDTMRARTIIAEYLQVDPIKVNVNVIGGNSNDTIVPLLSSTTPIFRGDREELEKISERIRNAGAAGVKAKRGKESAQLSMAYVAATFCNSLLQALEGKSGVIDVAYVESNIVPELKFFSSNVELNKGGIKKFVNLPIMSEYEKGLLKKAMPELQKSIDQGIQYVKSKTEKK